MEIETVTKSNTKRGGFRKGSGRKSTWNNLETTVIRVPKILTDKLVNIAHALNNGKAVHFVDEPEQAKRLKELLSTERNRMETAAQAKGLPPEKMPTWKNVQKLLHELEEILNSG